MTAQQTPGLVGKAGHSGCGVLYISGDDRYSAWTVGIDQALRQNLSNRKGLFALIPDFSIRRTFPVRTSDGQGAGT